MTMTMAVRLTPTQRKMYTLLLDGGWHSLVELHKCLWDDQSLEKTVATHLSALRDKIRPSNLHITRDTRDENGTRVTYYKMHQLD